MITRIYIESFGGLKDFELLPREGMNIIFGKNESGKTTVCSFIRAMLYGIDSERKRNIRQNFRKRFMPENREIMSGILETDDYIIKRTFGISAKYDTCNAIDRFSGELIDADKIGEAVTGMSEECFCNTFFMNSFDSYPTNEYEMMARLENISSIGSDNISYEKLIKTLDDMSHSYSKRSGILEKSLEASKNAQRNHEQELMKQHHLQELKHSIELLIQKRTNVENDLLQLEEIQKKAVTQTVELQNRQRELFSEMSAISERPNKLNYTKIIFGAVFFLIALLFLFAYKNSLFLIFAIAFVPSVILFRSAISERESQNSEQQAAVNMQLAAIEKIIQKTNAVENADIDGKIKQCRDYLIKCERSIAEKEFEINNTVIKSNSEVEAITAKSEYENNVFEYECIETAKKFIQQSYNELKNDFMPQVNNLFSQYFSYITDQKYTSAIADRNMSFSVIQHDNISHWEYLSNGTLDSAYFALRLALCELISKELNSDTNKKTFLILDDVFLQYDDERAFKTISLLSDVFSSKHQVLYFTCRKNFDNENANIIEL